jgi:hypothetical protein
MVSTAFPISFLIVMLIEKSRISPVYANRVDDYISKFNVQFICFLVLPIVLVDASEYQIVYRDPNGPPPIIVTLQLLYKSLLFRNFHLTHSEI